VLFRAVHDLRFSILMPELTHLQTKSSYQKLTEFIGQFPRKTTTAHVVAEISSRITRTKPKEGHANIWKLVYDEFSFMKMDEHLLRLVEMDQQLVAEVGATDAGVFKLALSFGTSKALVISIDRKLIDECNQASVHARHLSEITSTN
jgi:hypothetical protein